ncbi:hypothetical protein [Variovorax boronicumulans]|uniref:hypothetical protein n=1 Tax=Variovorax boronicumulans TaxID=436515 RepID=UPI0012FCECC9|nr:hypothetical protein [Variovorax boronicumulans]
MTDPTLEPWKTWVMLSLQLHGIDAAPGLQVRAARTLARLAPMTSRLAAGTTPPFDIRPVELAHE